MAGLAVSGQGSRFKEHLAATLASLTIDLDVMPYLSDAFPGTYCKNILLKDRRGQFYLVTYRADKPQLDLKRLKKDLSAHRNFSFASNEELFELMKCKSGAVSPFGLMYDVQNKVRLVVDEDLKDCTALFFHPFEESEMCVLSFEQLEQFCICIEKEVTFVKC